MKLINIVKTMTSNGKQFTVTHEMLTAVACDQSVHLKVAWSFKICFCFVLLERFSNDCQKTKTKAITPTNLNRDKHDEAIT